MVTTNANATRQRETSVNRHIAVTCTALLLAVSTVGAASQDYPARPITIIVPFAAGGPTDVLARNLAVAMSPALKQQPVIENYGGAGGTIGAGRAAKAQPDGYTLLLTHFGISTAPALYRKLPYDTINDLEPIGRVADVPMTLVAHKSMPATNLREFVEYAKAHKDRMTMGHAGLGSSSHLCGLMFMSAIGTEFTTVPYKGNGPAMNDLLGGQIDFMCDQTSNTTEQIKAGTIKVYGATSMVRVPSLPDLPTLDEQGLTGFEVIAWYGLWVPKATPKPVLDALSGALRVAVRDQTFKTRMADLGAVPASLEQATPEALREFLKSQIVKWGPVIKNAGVSAD
jgi:tripartite-type tricarboxylate transporter receptor subunit TctC